MRRINSLNGLELSLNDIKDIVRETVDKKISEDSWKNEFLEGLRLKLLIGDEFDRKMNSNLSVISTNLNNKLDNKMESGIRQVKNKVDNMKNELFNLKDVITMELSNYIKNHIPEHVSMELKNQIPVFVENNNKMQQILSEHSNKLKNQLETLANEILDKIVNEDEYHEINKKYFDAFNNNGNNAINEMIGKYNEKLVEEELKGNDLRTRIQNNCDAAMSNMSVGLNTLDQYHDTVRECEYNTAAYKLELDDYVKNNKKLEEDINILNNKITLYSYGLFGSIIGFAAFLFFKRR